MMAAVKPASVVDKRKLHDPIVKPAWVENSEVKCTSIVEWYKGRTILVTGGTGFMGKVLLEKLMRSCPGINKIFIIVRSKRGVSPSSRINDMIQLPLFQLLKKTNPNVFKKLVAIEGDITQDNLGISEENSKLLQSEVSVVFHCAATLRLEAVLKESVKHNLYATDYMFKFCSQIKKLEAIVHLSTAFCHCEVKTLEEKIYAPTQDPKHIMEIVEWMDEKSLETITPSIIEPHPNTYTFTKRLGETIAYEYGKKLPVIIIRPSIVIPTIKEPIPGWVDSLNGPVGVLVAAGKGVIRSMLVEADNHAEIVPADICINAIIIAAWHRGTQQFIDTPVYNCSQSDVRPTTWGEVLNTGRKLFQENPFDWPLWYPDGDIRTNRFFHHIIVFLFQIIPAYFMDVIFSIFMQKRFFVRVQEKIKLGMHLLQYFTLREWKFKNDEFLKVVESIPEDEMNIFYTTNIKFDFEEYLTDIILGTRLYCLKESPKNIPWAKKYLKFLYYLDRFTKLALIVGLFWLFLKHTHILDMLENTYYGVVKQN